ncbi:MAG: sulfatase [Bryobacteraceae bacterium]|nr:sulfatase [Bryobacteraceae bacterium]MDW8377918.1 sulfatase [Bryobacterales bacterium]
MNRREFLASAIAGLAPPSPPPPPRHPAYPQPTRKQNVILFLADDLGARDLGCYGSLYHDTPNLDRFAQTAMRFTQAYAASPVCSPSRASLLTGKYPARLRLTDWIPGRKLSPSVRLLTPGFEPHLPLSETTLAEALKPYGYVSACIGKWHLGSAGFSPREQGFAWNRGGSEQGSPPSYFPPYRIPGLEPRSDQEYLTDHLTACAEQFLEEHWRDPFFLYLAHFAVHTPLEAKPELVAKYEQRAATLRPQSQPTYAAMLESLDQSFGRILKKLEDLKIADRTAIFFLSDNGGLRFEGQNSTPVTDNAPLRAGKGHLYEGGIRIPFLVRWPGVSLAGASRVPVSTIDVMPTVLDLLGIPSPPLDGVSLAPLLRGSLDGARRDLFWHYPHYSNQGGVPCAAIRRGDYKLLEFFEDGRLELFHLTTDPSERRNLVNREASRAKELLNSLRNWRLRVGALLPQPNPNYEPAKAGASLAGVEAPTPPV